MMTLPERSSRETSGRPKANNFCWIFFIKFTGWSETRDRIRVTLGSRGRYLSHSVWRLQEIHSSWFKGGQRLGTIQLSRDKKCRDVESDQSPLIPKQQPLTKHKYTRAGILVPRRFELGKREAYSILALKCISKSDGGGPLCLAGSKQKPQP